VSSYVGFVAFYLIVVDTNVMCTCAYKSSIVRDLT
jgi:hypothetical protein